MSIHDIHGFVASSQRWIEEEYARIQKRAVEDPGTAGDEGENNWATLLKRWLPSCFHVLTKGRILTASGYASPQIDVVVLRPSYPEILLEKKLYLAGGVVAAFECKTTLKAEHIKAAMKTSAALRQNLQRHEGTPYKELNSDIIYGLLAHSHSWKGEKSTPIENVESTLWESDQEFVRHPTETMDFLCVADLATWTAWKMNYLNPDRFPNEQMGKMYGGKISTGYMCHAIGQAMQKDYFSPLGALLLGLFQKLSWTFPDIRALAEYFRVVQLSGNGEGKFRNWSVSVYSEKVRKRLNENIWTTGFTFDEWSIFS